MQETSRSLVLGLDIGSSSVGWALVRCDEQGRAQVVDGGVRVFPWAIEEDTLKSRNLERRAARQRRRQLERRARRRWKVARLLHRYGFLPPWPSDARIHGFHRDPQWGPLLAKDPYELRAKALDQRLEPWEFGRVMFHLAHRRGFSGLCAARDDEELTQIRKEIGQLEEEMKQTGARTLGEYLARLDPRERRRRARHTSRDWYRDEFEMIVDRQRELGLPLTDDMIKSLRRAIFHQRPLKVVPSAIGKCPLVKGRRRAPWGLLEAQEFRYLQTLNNLRVTLPNGVQRPLTPQERERVIQRLETVEELTFNALRKLLFGDQCKRVRSGHGREFQRLPSLLPLIAGQDTSETAPRDSVSVTAEGAEEWQPGWDLDSVRFNLQEGGRDCIEGNVTATRIRKAIGTKWDQATPEVRRAIVELLLGVEHTNVRKNVALRRTAWGLDEAEAERLSEVTLEGGRCRFSSTALRRLLPHLRQGLSLYEAIQREFPEHGEAAALDRVPPLGEEITNPLVRRALSETRRIVNAILKTYGKPDQIHIELARDLRRPLKAVRDMIWQMRERERERKEAAEKLREFGISEPTSRDIEKYLLWKECNARCPYTGLQIAMEQLFGPHPRFDIEHIIPWSRCLDDSFANKTLCEVEHNRQRKRNRMPTEAYDADELQAILARVREFTGPFAKQKLDRFQLTVPPELELVHRGDQLHATAHAARVAAQQLARLYPQEERTRRILVSSGRATAWLRVAWELNRLLGLADEKNRADHRHHLIDAVVVALTTPAIVKQLTEAAKRSLRPRTFVDMPVPEGLVDSLKERLEQVVVSHRVERKVQGQLHEETFYGLIRSPETGEVKAVVRKPIDSLSLNEAENIVDRRIREIVLEACEGKAPKDVFKDPTRIPMVRFGNREVRLRRVRIYVEGDPVELRPGDPRRAFSGSNHHVEVFNCHRGWRCEVVSRWEAMRRLRLGERVVRRQDEHGCPLVCSLARGDLVRLNWKGTTLIAVVQKFSERDYVFRAHNDGRMDKDIKQDRIRITSDRGLQKALIQKLSVDVLGRYHVSRE